jgi:DNA-binding CsgD family transcriptional regulator
VLFATQIARGDTAGAAESRDQLVALAASAGTREKAAADLASGVLGARLGEGKARAQLTRALELYASLELPLEAARCRLELARALAPDSPDAAAYEGRLALETFERLGATRDSDAAAELMRGLGKGGRTWPKGRGSLTKRETEVLALLAEGLSNAEIAERLFISVRTAEHHVANILGKLELRSRGEAAAYAVREAVKEP